MQEKKRTEVARLLRKKDTWAEKLVWSWLRNRRFSQYKFRRQHPFGPYILDFYCIEARLNIELDGSQHGFPEQQASDRQRDADLRRHGIQVMRFWNWRVRREKQVIRDAIWKALQERAPHPLPDYCRPMPPPELPQASPTQRTRGNAAYGARQLEEELREGEEADQDPGRD